MNTSAATTSPKRLHLTDADFARASEALGVEVIDEERFREMIS